MKFLSRRVEISLLLVGFAFLEQKMGSYKFVRIVPEQGDRVQHNKDNSV